MTIFFDLGGVLVDVHLDRFIDAMTRRTGRSPQQILADMTAMRPAYERFEKGACAVEEVLEQGWRLHGWPARAQEFIPLYTGIFTLNQEVAGLVEQLAARHRLSVISNTDVLHFDHIMQTYEVMKRFDRPITSFAAHALKPDPAIYRHALQVHRLSASEALFIDDKPENIAAAEALGMKGIVFTGVEQLRPALQQQGIACD